MYDDETLWKGVMKGDREMFLALYKKYYHSLLFIGLNEVKDSNLVKDAIQQQFLYLWEKRTTIQVAKNVKPYLVTSFLRRLTSDSNRTEKKGHLQMAWSRYNERAITTPEENLIIKDEQQKHYGFLAARVNALPARQKELIILKFYEGLSYEEIVQKTGLTHRSVYNNIYEALKKLKLEILKMEDFYSTALTALPGFFSFIFN